MLGGFLKLYKIFHVLIYCTSSQGGIEQWIYQKHLKRNNTPELIFFNCIIIHVLFNIRQSICEEVVIQFFNVPTFPEPASTTSTLNSSVLNCWKQIDTISSPTHRNNKKYQQKGPDILWI